MVEPRQAPLLWDSEWDSEWAYDKAEQAVKYLVERYPECAGSLALDPQRVAVYKAAAAEDRVSYEEALRDLMRAGRRVALEKRRR